MQIAYQFTGKERDAESGLDYFGARYFGSSMGRFMLPDEPMYSGDLGDPQKLNLYSYVGNNPLSRVDPDGHDYDICVDGGTCFNLTDDQYSALYKQQNGRQGINLPSRMGGAITCGGSVCGTANYFEKGLQDATLGPLLALDGARGAFSAFKGGISLGRSLMEGIVGLFGKTLLKRLQRRWKTSLLPLRKVVAPVPPNTPKMVAWHKLQRISRL